MIGVLRQGGGRRRAVGFESVCGLVRRRQSQKLPGRRVPKFQDEPDLRSLPNPQVVAGAVADNTRLEPDLEDLFWSTGYVEPIFKGLNFRGGESDALAYVLNRNLAYIVQFHPVGGEHGSNEFQIAHLLIDSK